MAAKNYTEILALVNAGNQMGLSNTIKRDYGIPLDFTSVQPSYDDAVIYAAENTKAYVGQPLSVGGKLYIINDVAAEAKHTVGEKEYDNYLVEVGSATEGDGVSIDLEAGVLTLHGFEGALAGYLPRKAEDGTLEWVPISAVVQGDGNKVTTLTSSDGSVEITKTTDTDESLVYDLKVAHPDPEYPEYSVQATRYDDDKYTSYTLTKDGEEVGESIVVQDIYDDGELRGRIVNIEDSISQYVSEDDLGRALAPYATIEYVDEELAKKAAQVDLVALEEKVDAFLTGTGAEDALDSLQELIEYINTHDDADINGILASIQAIENKLVLGTYTEGEEVKEYATVKAYVEAAIAALNINNYATKAELQDVNDKFDGYYTKDEINTIEENISNTYATKQELTDHANTINTTLNDYLTEADAETIYEKIGTAYTKNEVDAKIGTPGVPAEVDEEGNEITPAIPGTGVYQYVYSKSEVTDLIAEITGGESAADVKAELKEYKTTNDTRVKAIEEKNAAQDEAITNADSKGAQGIADAAAAKAIAEAASTQAATNKTDIAGHLTRIEVLETAKGDHATRISVAEGQITGLIAEDQKLNKAIGEAESAIVVLQGEDSRLAGLISTNTEALGKKANAADVYTKAETVLAIEDAIKAIPAPDFTPYLKSADAEITYATIASLESIYKAGSGEEGGEDYIAPSGILAEEIARAKAAEQKLSDDLALLIENPTDAIDSVRELITYVQEHGAVVDGILEDLSDHETRITALESKPDYVLPEATTSTLGGVKLSAEIGVNTEGQLKINTISTDLLVQGEATLVLNGGGASAN